MTLSLDERKALANFIEYLSIRYLSRHRNLLKEKFSDYELIYNNDITLYKYYNTIRELDNEVKKDVVQRLLDIWSISHDRQILYECLRSILYLKLCDTISFHRLNIIYLLLEEFADFSQEIKINGAFVMFNNGKFFVVTLCGDIKYGEDYNSFRVIISKEIFKGKYHVVSEHNASNALENFIDDLCTDNYITHDTCPWIQSYWVCHAEYPIYSDNVEFYFDNLEYIDNNGY